MKILGVLFLVVLAGVSCLAQKYPCLPAEIKEDAVVMVITQTTPKMAESIKPVTVRQTLKKRNARCSHGKLLDRKRKQIRFFKLQGCWGTPPPNAEEIMDKQAADIANLKKKYTVIEMTCNPTGLPLY